MMLEKVVLISLEFYKLTCPQITQSRILDFMKKLKAIQKELKTMHLKEVTCLLIEIIHHIKHIGRLVYYFSLASEEVTTKQQIDTYEHEHLFESTRKTIKEKELVEQHLLKFFQWKLKRWGLEHQQKLELQKLSEIIITCKICLNKVPSSFMNTHSGYCLKRAETLHELNGLVKTTNKYIAMVGEIKQFLITKTKLDM